MAIVHHTTPAQRAAVVEAERAWRPATPLPDDLRPGKYVERRATPTHDEVRDIAIAGALAQLFGRYGVPSYTPVDLATIAERARDIVRLCELTAPVDGAV